MHVNFLEPQYPYQGEGKKKMIAVIFLCFVVGGLFAGAAWAGAKVFNANADATTQQKVAPIDTSFVGKLKSLLMASSNQSMLGLANDRINIALLGIGGDGHDGAQLTDTILIANIQPSTKKVALLSIPRDTVVEIPGYGFHKINEANSDGEQISAGTGPDLALQTLDNFLGIDIPYYVRVDFSGFEQVVDDIGGVDVYVDKPFTDMDFPTWDFKIRTISFAQGWQHLDGARALDYARSRHGNNFEGSDFARARRQQKLLVAVRDKLLSTETFLHPTRITDILHTLDTHITTNINASNLLELAQIAKDVDTSKITNLIFSDDPASVLYPDSTTGAFYLRPKDPTLAQIHTIAQNIFNDEVTKSAQGLIDQQPLIPQKPDDTKIEVQNGTWRPGFAARQEKKLEADGFKVASIGNAAVRPIAETQIYAVTQKNPATFEKLKKRYNAVELTIRPALSPDNTSGTAPAVDIIVILGENAPDIAE